MKAAIPASETALGEVFAGDSHACSRVELIEVNGHRRLLVDLDFAEAIALERSLIDDEQPRPMPYQFVVALLIATDVRVQRVHIAEPTDFVLRAEVVLTNGAIVDARLGDALNVAALTRAPISVDQVVFHSSTQPGSAAPVRDRSR